MRFPAKAHVRSPTGRILQRSMKSFIPTLHSSRSRLGPHCKRVSLAQTPGTWPAFLSSLANGKPRISDEEALAALEAVKWSRQTCEERVRAGRQHSGRR